jgi:hypothetical protein
MYPRLTAEGPEFWRPEFTLGWLTGSLPKQSFGLTSLLPMR